MQSLEQFMKEYFCARIAEAKRELIERASHRKKYYTDECTFDSRIGTIKMIEFESRSIISCSMAGDEGEVFTRTKHPRHDFGFKQRYRLKAEGEGWLVRRVDFACFQCDGEYNNKSCVFCHGEGWMNPDRPGAAWPQIVRRPG